MMPIATSYHWQRGIISFRDNFSQISRNSYLFFYLFVFQMSSLALAARRAGDGKDEELLKIKFV